MNISYDNNHALQLCSNLVEKAGQKKGGRKERKRKNVEEKHIFLVGE